MKEKTTEHLYRAVEHSVTLTPDDLLAAIGQEDSTAAITLLVDDSAVMPQDTLIEAVKKAIPAFPTGDFQVGITVSWTELEKIEPPPAASPIPAPRETTARQATLAANLAAPLAPQTAQPGQVIVCQSCGAKPALEGPTPACRDAEGCGPFNRMEQQISAASPQAPSGGRSVFLSPNGEPYGFHTDYTK